MPSTTLRATAATAAIAALALAGCDSDSTSAASSTATTTVTAAAETSTVTAAPSTSPAAPPATATGAPEGTGPAPAAGDSPASRAPEGCGAITATQARADHVAKVTPDKGMEWSTTDTEGLAGFDPCLDLSYIVLSTKAGTGSSPSAIMLFHRGEYLGTASKENFGFTPQVARLAPNKIQVTYRYLKPGESTAGASGRAVSTFTYDAAAGKVVHAGEWPPAGNANG